MEFNDVYVNQENRFSIGVESESGKYYLSIPVSNGIVDYEEYYEITKEQFETFKNVDESTLHFVEKCRNREQDQLLIMEPGKNRGTPV